MRSLSDILIKDLMDKVFKTFFGLQGGASARIIESVINLGGKFHPVLNEQAAGYAAHGYFLTNNRPDRLIFTTGQSYGMIRQAHREFYSYFFLSSDFKNKKSKLPNYFVEVKTDN